jgi:NtrC-family two-component system response regulator AlgB
VRKLITGETVNELNEGMCLRRLFVKCGVTIAMTELQAAADALNILIVDDEINIRKILAISLEAKGHKVVAVSNFQDAVAEAARRSFDMAFVDLRLGATDGLDLIPVLLASAPWLKIVVITAYSSIDTAVEAMRRGATDYIPKPFTTSQVNIVVSKVCAIRALEQRVTVLQEQLGRAVPDEDFTSHSPSMQRAVRLAREAAASDANILLQGESGTGKSALGRAIHHWSGRAQKPLGVISCPALSAELLESELFGHVKGAFTGAIRDYPGRIATCEGGSLFLDEIGDVPMAVQPKLLRFLQDREYERVGDHVTRKADVRIIAATNVDLEQAVQDKRFREDLFYRLNVIQIEIPPLRDRLEDIPALAAQLLAFFSRRNRRQAQRFTEEALQAMKQYDWPGNVRELSNIVERASVLCKSDLVGAEYLLDKMMREKPQLKLGDPAPLARIEEEHVRRVLASTKSLQQAADILGIDQATLWRRRKQYGI